MFTVLRYFTKFTTCSRAAFVVGVFLNNKKFIIRDILASSLCLCSRVRQAYGFIVRIFACPNAESCFLVLTWKFTSQTKFGCSSKSQENYENQLWKNILECLRNLRAGFCSSDLAPSSHGNDLDAVRRLLKLILSLHEKCKFSDKLLEVECIQFHPKR